jgi:transcriptional regulator with XRE-family HTH domain
MLSERERTRAKILGVLLQDARRKAGRSVGECAEVLRISPEAMERAERGEQVVSLPDLEILAMFLKVPLAHFWGSQTISEEEKPDFAFMASLRQRMIGALLHQARLQANRTVQQLADEIKVDPARILDYEAGKEAVPLFQLERLGRFLGVSLGYFSDDQHGPLARHEAEQKMKQRFENLPANVKAFVVEPINLSYLETAMRLSEMDVRKLRSIAEGLLDITF